MLTRCPECATTFRVTPEQLKARSGRVRCGACGAVFDALATLAEEPARVDPQVAEEPPPAMDPAGAASAEETGVGAESRMPEEPAEAIAIDAGELEATDTDTTAEPESAVHEEVRIESPAAADQPAIASPAADEPAVERPAVEEPAAESPAAAGRADDLVQEPAVAGAGEAPRRRVWPWFVGASVAAVVLALQALLHFRTELAVLYPETRPALLAACDLLGCELPRPRKPELVGIESSDISVADSRLALSATLKNRAPFAQEYPYMELALTDTADRPLVRRVLAPAEYLPPTHMPAAGFGARAEIAISLSVALHDVKPAGYRLYLFYP